MTFPPVHLLGYAGPTPPAHVSFATRLTRAGGSLQGFLLRTGPVRAWRERRRELRGSTRVVPLTVLPEAGS